MKTLKYLILLVTIGIFTNCTKEDIVDSIHENCNSKILLTKRYSRSDTTEFIYNDQNNLSSIIHKSVQFDPTTNSPFVDTFKIDYTYSNGLVDKRITQNGDYLQFIYEGENLIIENPFSFSPITKKYFDFTNENVSKLQINFDSMITEIFPEFDNNKNITKLRTNNNICLADSSINTSNYAYNLIGSMQYDKKRNYLSLLPKEIIIELEEYNNPNNLVYKEILAWNKIRKVEYEYNECDLPLKSTMRQVEIGAMDTSVFETIHYEYIFK